MVIALAHIIVLVVGEEGAASDLASESGCDTIRGALTNDDGVTRYFKLSCVRAAIVATPGALLPSNLDDLRAGVRGAAHSLNTSTS